MRTSGERAKIPSFLAQSSKYREGRKIQRRKENTEEKKEQIVKNTENLFEMVT